MKNERQQYTTETKKRKAYIWTAMLLLMVLLIGGMGIKAGVSMQELYGPNRRIERCRTLQNMRKQMMETSRNTPAIVTGDIS